MRSTLPLIALFICCAVGWGQVLQADSFTCNGVSRGGWCWLSDGQLFSTASWRFTNVPQGSPIPMTLEGVAYDICRTCEVGRDVYVRVFYRSEGDRYWQRADLRLRNVNLEAGCLVGYTVRGTTTVWPTGPNLLVMVQRILTCDPHVGFNQASLTLGAAPTPPPPQVPLPPALPPVVVVPPPEPRACEVALAFDCTAGAPPAECLAPGLNLLTVARTILPESFGPDESAVVLGYGHYQGSLGEDDYQDWYRVKLPFGSAKILWIDPGNLVVDVFIVHDPCGDVLGACLEVSSPRTITVPCRVDMECAFFNSGTFCFTGTQCSYFIRIARRSGSGTYRFSLLPAFTETE